MKVVLRLQNSSEPMVFEATNAYTKGEMYCLRLDDGTLKFPLRSIFSVHESNSFTSQLSKDVGQCVRHDQSGSDGT